MPRTGPKESRELAIQLDDHRAYYPGDTIIGRVIRTNHTVSTRAQVSIKLYGRAKTKLTVRRNNGNGSSTHHYRGRFYFFAGETCQKIFDGPVHIPPNGSPQTWAFSLNVPMGPSPGSLRAENQREHGFLPLTTEAIAASTLPSSFAFKHPGWRKEFDSFVEYYIEAEFWQENTTHLSKSTYPIIVLEPPIPYPLETLDLKTARYPGFIKTQRLIPGMEDAELTFHQKMQKFLGSSKVTQFAFYVQVDSPTVIQMQHPNPISFRVHVVADRGRTSEIIADVPQTIRITSLDIEIEATTSIICDGAFSPKTASGTQMYLFAERGSILGLRSPITIKADSNWETLDIGTMMGLSLHPQYAVAEGRPLLSFGQIYPSFVTYNIKHSHQLKWKLTLEAAGETMRVRGLQSLSILAASQMKVGEKKVVKEG